MNGDQRDAVYLLAVLLGVLAGAVLGIVWTLEGTYRPPDLLAPCVDAAAALDGFEPLGGLEAWCAARTSP